MLLQQLSDYKNRKLSKEREEKQLKMIKEYENENEEQSKNLLEIDYGDLCYKSYCETFDLYEKKNLSQEEKRKYTDMALDLFIKFSEIYKTKKEYMEDFDLVSVYNYFLHRADTLEEVLELIKQEEKGLREKSKKNYFELEDKDFEDINSFMGKSRDVYETKRRYLENVNKAIEGLKFIEFMFKGGYDNINKAKIDYELSKIGD